MIQPPPGAFDTRVNDHNPSVVPGTQSRVTDEQPGIADRLRVPTGRGVVVDGGGGGRSVVVGGVMSSTSSSVVVTSRVRSATLS